MDQPVDTPDQLAPLCFVLMPFGKKMDAAGRVTETGWALEMRIPFASLRYEESDPEQWRIMLYRNMPREFRYQMFTSRLPRDSNCFICNTRPLVGLAGLPSGSHWVLAPYATGSQVATPEGGSLGGDLASDDPSGDVGLDAKWIPNPSMVFDATLNPDFSQIESDTAQIAANERFALFFPERRPFFLESVDMFSTPLDAIYTRRLEAVPSQAGVARDILVSDHHPVWLDVHMH